MLKLLMFVKLMFSILCSIATADNCDTSRTQLRGLEALNRRIASPKRSCEIVDTVGASPMKELSEKLSPFWAQEVIGVDIAREIVIESSAPSRPVAVGTFEAIDLRSIPNEALSEGLRKCKFGEKSKRCRGFLEVSSSDALHGTLVANLVASTPQTGAGARAQISVAGSGIDTDDPTQLRELSAQMVKSGVRIASVSLRGKEFDDTFKDLHAGGVVVVASAGNNHPLFKRSQSTVGQFSIVVGSISPVGGMASTSSEGEDVFIGAPSDQFLASSFKNKIKYFGGTSGAQPLVAGSIANVMSFLPDLTLEEAKELIKRTAIQTANSSESPKMNGVGMINAAKMAEVARTLADGWPHNRARIFLDPSLYDYKQESLSAMERGSRLLASQDTCEKAKGFKLMRKAFLLDNDNLEALDKLVSLYESLGYDLNATFYRALKSKPSLADLQAIYEKYPTESLRASVVRASDRFGSGAIPLLKTALSSDQASVIEMSAFTMHRLGQDTFLQGQLLNIFKDSKKDENSRMMALGSAVRRLKLDPYPFLDHCLKGADAFARNTCLAYAIDLGPGAKEYLQIVLLPSSISERKDLLQRIRSIEPTRRPDWVIQFLRDHNSESVWDSEDRKILSDLMN